MTNPSNDTRTVTTVRNETTTAARQVAMTSRWSGGRSKPKLVTFSWGATVPSMRR